MEARPAPQAPPDESPPSSSGSLPESEAAATGPTSSPDEAQGPLIQVQIDGGAAVMFRLNGSAAASSLYRQLPLSVGIEDYAGSEKIFYPPEGLDTSRAPLAQGPAGTLAYYEPWGDVALFYGNCGGASGLYALGEAVSGAELIPSLAGEVQIDKVEEDALPQEAKIPAPAPQAPQQKPASPMENTAMPQLQITVGDKRFAVTLNDNETARALMQMLPLTLRMSEMNGNEKYYYFSDSLPADAGRPSEIQAGDLMLYSSDCLVLFYESFSTSHRYTTIGRIDDPAGLSEALGAGEAAVSFRVAE
ncbi:cyclophilin-like fold protein [Harryflintia acetispora]|uniref:cyclophilin-like fold protein n=1 Tax=Harryflintia acetispora TaxID=1849041 RepID=UPI003307523D